MGCTPGWHLTAPASWCVYSTYVNSVILWAPQNTTTHRWTNFEHGLRSGVSGVWQEGLPHPKHNRLKWHCGHPLLTVTWLAKVPAPPQQASLAAPLVPSLLTSLNLLPTHPIFTLPKSGQSLHWTCRSAACLLGGFYTRVTPASRSSSLTPWWLKEPSNVGCTPNRNSGAVLK
jgi:hypothetical protein